MLLFCNSTTVSLFLCRVRTAQPYVMLSQTQLLSLLTQFSTRCWARDVPRLDGARGRKQVWRPHVRTWGLSEANFLYWTEYLWHCFDFSAPPWWLDARGIVPPLHGPGLDCTKLVCFLQVYFFNAWWQPRKERQQWKSECNMKNNCLKNLQASKMKTKNQFQGCCQWDSWVRSLSAS